MELVDAVAVLLQEVAAREMMSRFGHLRSSDIQRKQTEGDPDDIVTVVDRAVEAALERHLGELVPGSRVVGEEAASAAPGILDALSDSSPVWLIDPLDGTRNFAQGDDGFGVMVALVERGTTSAGWIFLPARNQLLTARKGGGAYLNGSRIRTPPRSGRLRGTLYSRFMPIDIAEQVSRMTVDKYDHRPIPGSAAVEYSALVHGAKDFVIYYRLLPWDHAPGALILSEAGGFVSHRDGHPYSPRSPNSVTICAGSASVGSQVREWLTHDLP